MTTIADAIDRACWSAKQLKHNVVAALVGQPAELDLAPVILAYRGEDLIASVQPARLDPELSVLGLRMAAFGFNADLIAVVHESYQMGPGHPDNPVTGRPWGPGEMQNLALHADALTRGWVRECLAVAAANRAGDLAMRTLPYKIDGAGLLWLAEHQALVVDQDAVEVTGYLANGLRDAMAAPSVLQERELDHQEAVAELGLEHVMALGDLANAAAMSTLPYRGEVGLFEVGLSAEQGTLRAEILARGPLD